jgi:replication factor C subunit 2/4
MILQNTKYMIKKTNKITVDDIIRFTGGVENIHLNNFWKTCINGNCLKIRNLTLDLQKQGYQVKYILNYIKKCVIGSKLNNLQKSEIAIFMCGADKMLTEGGDEYLQILNVLLFINMINKNK